MLSVVHGEGYYGIYLDETLYEGSSAHCPTSDDDPLCTSEPGQGGTATLECVGLEVWAMTIHDERAGTTSMLEYLCKWVQSVWGRHGWVAPVVPMGVPMPLPAPRSAHGLQLTHISLAVLDS